MAQLVKAKKTEKSWCLADVLFRNLLSQLSVRQQSVSYFNGGYFLQFFSDHTVHMGHLLQS